MSDLGPDTLRKLVAHGKGTPTEYIVKRSDIDDHADAWKAERADCLAEHPPEPWTTKLQAENDDLRERLAAAERERDVGNRMHDFLCRLFSNPRILPEGDGLAIECWGLMQDWTVPPALAAPKRASCPDCKVLVFEGEEHRMYCPKHDPAALAAGESGK